MLKDEMDVLRHSQEKVVGFNFVGYLSADYQKGEFGCHASTVVGVNLQ